MKYAFAVVVIIFTLLIFAHCKTDLSGFEFGAPVDYNTACGEPFDGEFPWLVNLYRTSRQTFETTKRFLCNGNIIDRNTVIIPAHCVTQKNSATIDPNDLSIEVGKTTFHGRTINTREYTGRELLVHPGFNLSRYTDDIALLKLTELMTFSSYVHPICLTNDTSKFNKTQYGIVPVWASTVQSAINVSQPSPCGLPSEKGNCSNYAIKYYFDNSDYGGCSRFWYGGCGGNENRFDTKDDCENYCIKPAGKNVCNLPKSTGPCTGYFPMYYYDSESNTCSQFIYGGCMGNNNRFETRDKCLELCSVKLNVYKAVVNNEYGHLNTSYLPIIYDNAECTRRDSTFFDVFLDENKFCAGKPGIDNNLCHGFTGVSLSLVEETYIKYIWYLKGILSIGKMNDAGNCARDLLIFIDVFKYYNWIVENKN